MILSGYWTSRGEVVEIGIEIASLAGGSSKQSEAGHFTPIGSDGFWTRGMRAPGSISSRWKLTP